MCASHADSAAARRTTTRGRAAAAAAKRVEDGEIFGAVWDGVAAVMDERVVAWRQVGPRSSRLLRDYSREESSLPAKRLKLVSRPGKSKQDCTCRAGVRVDSRT